MLDKIINRSSTKPNKSEEPLRLIRTILVSFTFENTLGYKNIRTNLRILTLTNQNTIESQIVKFHDFLQKVSPT